MEYLRVTRVLDHFQEPELVDWKVRKGRDAKKIGRQAMKIGTEVDLAVKQFVTTGQYGKVKTVEAKSCLEGFKRWYEDYRPKLTVGTRLYHDKLGVTGEPDLLDEVNRRVIDLKCASAIRPKYHLQNGMYALMVEYNATGILRLHKQLEDYEYKTRDGEEVLDDQAAFEGLLVAYKRLVLPGEREYFNADNPTDRAIRS